MAGPLREPPPAEAAASPAPATPGCLRFPEDIVDSTRVEAPPLAGASRAQRILLDLLRQVRRARIAAWNYTLGGHPWGRWPYTARYDCTVVGGGFS
jgi:hypothetical protein